mmetsp:Transcript_14391/g.18856  ORF Transcript_14391/g.18856 Transcript_14391/m.18856 type:complete len:851 (+) Transcript_14391:129-2681(+)
MAKDAKIEPSNEKYKPMHDEEDDDDEDSDLSEEETESEDDDSVGEEAGVTENQKRLLYMISLYTKAAQNSEEKDEWIRKNAVTVLIYEGVVANVLDYDYAPSSFSIESQHIYMNVSQEGASDIDFLCEESLIKRLKLSSNSAQPITCYQIAEKGHDLVDRIKKSDRMPVNELVFAPGSRNLLRVEWDTSERKFFLLDPLTGYSRESNVTETEDVSYVSSAYIPQCLRHGGRPTLSNAHRAHESGMGEANTNLRDELDEVITLNSVSILVSEFIPFGANNMVAVNQNIGATERVQGGVYTMTMDEEPEDKFTISIDPGLTRVEVLDFSLSNHCNFEADIHFPEDPGIVQIETFGLSVNSVGSCFYGMQIESVVDRIRDGISLDHLARLLVDVQIDSSQIVDSIISKYQRDVLNLLFTGDAPNRNKVKIIIANEIVPHLVAEEYMDRGEYENELKQVLGDTRTAFDISEHDVLIFGDNGLLLAGPNSRHHEPLLCAYLSMINIDLFLRSFFARYNLELQQMHRISAVISNPEDHPLAIPDTRESLVTTHRNITMLEEILGYVDEALKQIHLPPEPPEQTGRALYERLDMVTIKTQLEVRTMDLYKMIRSCWNELKVLQDMTLQAADNRLYKLQETVERNTKNLIALQEMNQKATFTLEMMLFLIAGTLAFDFLDRITGDWSVTTMDWMQQFVLVMFNDNPGLWFFMSLFAWAFVILGVILFLQRRETKAKGNMFVEIEIGKFVNLSKLQLYLKNKKMTEEEHVHERLGNHMVKIKWKEEDKREWGGFAPTICISYDEKTFYCQSVTINYNRRQASKVLGLNASELKIKVLEDFDKGGVFANPEDDAPKMALI